MHDRAVVVRPNVITISYVLVEVVFESGSNVRPVNSYKLIAIFTALLVPESDHVANLMNRVAHRAA